MSSGMFNTTRIKTLESQLKEVIEKLELLEKRITALESK